jgi:hypothetical protein
MKAAVATVVTDPRIVVDDNRLVVDVRYVGDVNVGHATVVIEPVALPIPAEKSGAGVTKAIINAAVETDVWSPIAAIPNVEAVIPAPVARSPKHSDGSKHPRARNPVVAVVVIPRPVARRPDVALSWTQGLNINGQRRWTDPDRNSNADLGGRRGTKGNRHYQRR